MEDLFEKLSEITSTRKVICAAVTAIPESSTGSHGPSLMGKVPWVNVSFRFFASVSRRKTHEWNQRRKQGNIVNLWPVYRASASPAQQEEIIPLRMRPCSLRTFWRRPNASLRTGQRCGGRTQVNCTGGIAVQVRAIPPHALPMR